MRIVFNITLTCVFDLPLKTFKTFYPADRIFTTLMNETINFSLKIAILL